MALGGKNFIPEEDRLSKEEYYAKVPKANAQQILHEAKQLVEFECELSEFEHEFITELARCAAKFGEEFRMSKSQNKIRDQIWTKYILPNILKKHK